VVDNSPSINTIYSEMGTEDSESNDSEDDYIQKLHIITNERVLLSSKKLHLSTNPKPKEDEAFI
jgi:hypothetical protein